MSAPAVSWTIFRVMPWFRSTVWSSSASGRGWPLTKRMEAKITLRAAEEEEEKTPRIDSFKESQ